nr:hypothetical protein [Paenibacillus ihumii]
MCIRDSCREERQQLRHDLGGTAEVHGVDRRVEGPLDMRRHGEDDCAAAEPYRIEDEEGHQRQLPFANQRYQAG